MYKIYAILVFFTFLGHQTFGQEKQKLSHDDYESWNTLSGNTLSDNGQWVTWQVNPQKGDGILHIKSTTKAIKYSFARGHKPQFSPSQNFLVFEQKVPEEARRKAIKDQVKKDDQPKPSLFIVRLDDFLFDSVADLSSWVMAKKNRDLVLYTLNGIPEKPDADDEEGTDFPPEEKSKKKPKLPKGVNPLYFVKLGDTLHHFLGLSNLFQLSHRAEAIVYSLYSDSLESYEVRYYDLASGKDFPLLSDQKDVSGLAISPHGTKVVVISTTDTLDKIESTYNFHFFEVVAEAKRQVRPILNLNQISLTDTKKLDWEVSPETKPYFTEDGKFLYFGVYPDRPKMVKDTALIPEDEAHVDIWTPYDRSLSTRQLAQRKKWENYTRTMVFTPRNKSFFLLEGSELSSYQIKKDTLTHLLIHTINLGYESGKIWEFERNYKFELINLETRQTSEIAFTTSDYVRLSPGGKYAYWFDRNARKWKVYDIASGETRDVGTDIDVSLINEEVDVPGQKPGFGAAGWTENDNRLWVYGKHDIFAIDPHGRGATVLITNDFGQNNNFRLRYLKTHSEEKFIGEFDRYYLSAFQLFTKESRVFELNAQTLQPVNLTYKGSLISFSGAKTSPVFMYRTGNFRQYPELLLWRENQTEILSETNPQQSDYCWGDVSFVDYVVNGDSLRGMLYLPECATSVQLPLIVYFYEKNSDNFYRHTIPTPSRSIINFPYYLSNGYAIFVPDIVYETGEPGASAYRCIMTGVDTLLRQHKNIDESRMALNGQSWGGYQSAWLITQTNRFKAAFSGAPVSNMTSAYGGIRWKTGHSRIMQYEEGQSRMGVPMSEDLKRYLENSPVFYVQNIETPLLIMHNDNDGAVPWYQGIELYMSMIREGKDVWMLVYNNEEHNLTRWANRMDLSKRVSDFYDHYLMGTPRPDWMEKGVGIWEKGKIPKVD
ncbi:MAG: S9 family peptidase [Cryomorphaceae bacterium]|nr:S9 family peptidase [Cryomorphaceae bacterium]